MIHARAINHIGIAVPNIDAQREFYEKTLGAKFEGCETVADQKVKVGFFLLGPEGAQVRLELLEPTAPDSPIAKYLEKNPHGGLHHVAYTVDDIQKRLDDLKASGLRLIDETPRPGAHHTQIAFLHPKSSHGVLTELCQPKKA
ncbi:MAG: methylmalonyl-CoA epimerase [Phycisphaera sp.]|nr:methylmalonyl-CoA epimerase [Phycisphaera sp.]